MIKKCFYSFVCCVVHTANILSSSAVYNELLMVQRQPLIQLLFNYNINSDYVTTTTANGGTVTQSVNMAVLQTSANILGSAQISSVARFYNKPGQHGVAQVGAIFTAGVTNSTQIIGIGTSENGFFFGYNGTLTTVNFGILHRNNSVDTWIAQTNWNADTLDGSGSSGVTLVPTNGNVYKIEFQDLGFGAVKFYVADPTTGEFILVHTIEYPNSSTSVSLRNYSMPLMAQVRNVGNLSNITLRTPSMSAMLGGFVLPYVDSRFSATFLSTKAITTTVNNILTILNQSTYAGVTNQTTIFVDQLQLMKTGADNNPLIVRLYINPTVGGTPAFSAVGTNSVVAVDNAGTTITGGRLIATFFPAGNATPITRAQRIDLSDMDIKLNPGDRLTVTANTTTGTASLYAGLSWRERF